MDTTTNAVTGIDRAKEGLSGSFWLVLSGQWISQIGDGLYIVALPMFILAGRGTGLSLGLVMAATLFPFALLSPFAGVLADRWQRKWLLVTTDALSGVLALIVAYLAWNDQLTTWTLFLAGAGLSAAAAFFFPTLMASVPNLVHSTQLTRANSLMEFGRNTSAIIGPALGGVLLVTLGFPLAFLLNAISFWISALMVSLSSIPQTETPPSAANVSILSDLAGGVKYLLQHRLLLSIAGIIALLNFFEPAILPIVMPIVADQVLRVGDVGYGLMRALYGLGGFISLAALAMMMERPRKHRLIAAGIGAMGGVFLLMGAGLMVYPIVLTTLFLYGVLAGVTNTLVLVVLQAFIPDKERGKVFGLIATISAILIPISFLVVGLALDYLSPIWLLLISAAALVVGAVAVYRTPGIRNL